MTLLDKLNSLEQDISFLRQKMHEVIESKNNLLNPDVIEISQMLDEVLTKHYETIKEYNSSKNKEIY